MQTDFDKLVENIDALKAESDAMQGRLSAKRAKNMLVLSECVTAGLQAFLFKMRLGDESK